MKATIHGGFILLFSILQATWLDSIEVFGVKPNLFLIYVIILCCFCERTEGAAVGFAFGFALDMLIGKIWGLNASLGMILGFCVAHFCEKFLSNNNIFIVLGVVFVASLLHEAVCYLISFLTSEDLNFWLMLVRCIIPECVYNVVMGIPLYFIIKGFAKRLYKDKGEIIG